MLKPGLLLFLIFFFLSNHYHRLYNTLLLSSVRPNYINCTTAVRRFCHIKELYFTNEACYILFTITIQYKHYHILTQYFLTNNQCRQCLCRVFIHVIILISNGNTYLNYSKIILLYYVIFNINYFTSVRLFYYEQNKIHFKLVNKIITRILNHSKIKLLYFICLVNYFTSVRLLYYVQNEVHFKLHNKISFKLFLYTVNKRE